MTYDLPLRFLARAFLKAAPPLTIGPTSSAAEILVGGPVQMTNVQQIELATGQMFSRIELADAARTWLIHLPGPSIDVTLLPGDNSLQHDLRSFADGAGAFIEAFLATHKLEACRLALVQEGLLPSMNDALLDAVAAKVMLLPELMRNNAPFEWDWRAASKVDRTFGGHTERSNTVIGIKRIQGTIRGAQGDVVGFDRIRLDVDTNTDPVLDAERFSGADARAFFAQAHTWHAQIEGQLDAMIGAPQ